MGAWPIYKNSIIPDWFGKWRDIKSDTCVNCVVPQNYDVFPLLMMHKTCSINYGHLVYLLKTLPTTDLNKKNFPLIKYLLTTFIFVLSFQSVLVFYFISVNAGENGCMRSSIINHHWHIEAEAKWTPVGKRRFQMHFLEWKCRNFAYDSLKFVPKVLIDNIAALVQMLAWRRPGDNPLSGPKMACLLKELWGFCCQHSREMLLTYNETTLYNL